MADEQEILNRWRLVLGKYASEQISFSSGDVNYMDMENLLDYLYSREYGEEQEIRRERTGGSDGSRLTVPDWLHKIKKLFPKRTVEAEDYSGAEAFDEGRGAHPGQGDCENGGGGDRQEAGTGGEDFLFRSD